MATKPRRKASNRQAVIAGGLRLPPACADAKLESRSFIDPDGHVYPVSCVKHPKYGGCYWHNCFAQTVLQQNKLRPSPRAEHLAELTEGDLPPSECELIVRGWTRQNDCHFTIPSRRKSNYWNAYAGAAKHGCTHITINALDEDMDRTEDFGDSNDLARQIDLMGLPQRKRGRR